MPTLHPDLDRRSYDKVWRCDFAPAEWGMPILLEGGLSFQRVPISLDPHRHQGYELHYIKRGSLGLHCDDGSEHEVRGGQFSLTLPGVGHRGVDAIIRPSDLLWLVIDPRRAGAGQRLPFLPDDLQRMVAVFDAVGNGVAQAPADTAQVFDDFAACCRRIEQEGMSEQDPIRLAQFLGAIILRAFAAFAEPRPLVGGDLGGRAIAWLTTHLYEDIGVDDLAAAMGLGRSRLHDRFRAEQGETPATALRRLRCAEAAHLLRNTNQSIAMIAGHLRFATPQHFARVFRNFTGKSPSAFREER